MRIRLWEGRYAVARMAAEAAVPSWAEGAFTSVTRTGSELSIVLKRALAKEPAARFQTANDLADELQRIRTRVPIRSRRMRPGGLWLP